MDVNMNLIEIPSIKMELTPIKSRPTCYAAGGVYKNWGDGTTDTTDKHKYNYSKIKACVATVYGLKTTIPENFCYTSFTNNIIKAIYINSDIKIIMPKAFYNCTGMENITYNGTKEDWKHVLKGLDWNFGVPAKIIHCIDGDVAL